MRITDEAHHAAMPDDRIGAINLAAALLQRCTDMDVRVVGMAATPCRLEDDYENATLQGAAGLSRRRKCRNTRSAT